MANIFELIWVHYAIFSFDYHRMRHGPNLICLLNKLRVEISLNPKLTLEY